MVIHNLPVLTNVRELPSAARKFLFFTVLNLVSWQCIVGQVLVLFGRAINMPPSWIGVVVSFMPLSMLLVIISVPVVEAYGPRKLLVTTWLIRNIVTASVFAIPWAMGLWGERAAWHILLFAILCFSLARAIGVGAWYPWLHELVPKHQLGLYFSIETTLVQILNVVVAFGVAGVLNMGESLNRFNCVYAIGIAFGLISVLFVKKIPGGLRSEVDASTDRKFSVICYAAKQKKYRRFMYSAVISMFSLIWLNISSILYLRDVLGYKDAQIMWFVAAGAVGVALTVRYWVRFAKTYGNYTAMAALIAAHSFIAAGWCGLLSDVNWTLTFTLPLIVLCSVFNAGFMILASQSMMSLVQTENRVGYTSLWIIGVSISNGIPSVMAGWIIDLFHISGYRICFLISCGFGFFVAFLWRMFRFDEEESPLEDISPSPSSS